jgi:hypothetical protein
MGGGLVALTLQKEAGAFGNERPQRSEADGPFVAGDDLIHLFQWKAEQLNFLFLDDQPASVEPKESSWFTEIKRAQQGGVHAFGFVEADLDRCLELGRRPGRRRSLEVSDNLLSLLLNFSTLNLGAC